MNEAKRTLQFFTVWWKETAEDDAKFLAAVELYTDGTFVVSKGDGTLEEAQEDVKLPREFVTWVLEDICTHNLSLSSVATL